MILPTDKMGLLIKFFPYLKASCFGSIEQPTHIAKFKAVGLDHYSTLAFVCWWPTHNERPSSFALDRALDLK